MKSIVFENPDSPCVIKENPLPMVKPGQVLVRLMAAALNRRDYWIKKGIYKGARFPCIVGSDGSGIVEETGPDVSVDWLGKPIIINPGFGWGNNPMHHAPEFRILGLPDQGTLAEYIVVDASNILPTPEGWTYEQSAALPLAGLTAFRALFTRAGLTKGEKVLITGAGGGVASYLIAFSNAANAEVYVTSGNDKKIKKAQTIGALAGVNYNQPKWDDQLREIVPEGFDLIVDSAAGNSFALLPGLLRIGGRVVIFGGTAGPLPSMVAASIFWKQASILGTTMGSPLDFKGMINFVSKNNILPVIDKIFPFEDTELAFNHMENFDHFGKIIIKIAR